MKDGGPAFPFDIQMVHQRERKATEGMSLRDYFAAKAMQGFLAGPSMTAVSECAQDAKMDEQTFIVTTAYQIADAMLKAREVT